MANTTKRQSDYDANNATRAAFNDVNATISTDGFLVGKVGRKIEMNIITTNVPNDSEEYIFSEDSVNLYTLTVVYTDGSRTTLLSAERTA
jgi:hypothetical protein